MKYVRHDGIIINRHLVADADRFFTIMTYDEGKIEVYGKGVRKIQSKRSASLDLFSLIRFEYVEKGERRTLTHVELLDGYREGKKKLGDISRLFVIGELIDALVPENDPHPEVYNLLNTAIANLPRFASEKYLLRFKKRLIHLLGYGHDVVSDQNIDIYIESLISRSLHAKII